MKKAAGNIENDEKKSHKKQIRGYVHRIPTEINTCDGLDSRESLDKDKINQFVEKSRNKLVQCQI